MFCTVFPMRNWPVKLLVSVTAHLAIYCTTSGGHNYWDSGHVVGELPPRVFW